MHILVQRYVLYAQPHSSDGACEHWLRSRLYVSPPQLCHTPNGTSRHAQLGRRLLQDGIRLRKLYSIFLLPASLYAAAITSHRICFNCSHSCEILCTPMFYGRPPLTPPPVTPQCLYLLLLAFLISSLHLCIFSKLFAVVDGVVCFFLDVIAGSACIG